MFTFLRSRIYLTTRTFRRTDFTTSIRHSRRPNSSISNYFIDALTGPPRRNRTARVLNEVEESLAEAEAEAFEQESTRARTAETTGNDRRSTSKPSDSTTSWSKSTSSSSSHPSSSHSPSATDPNVIYVPPPTSRPSSEPSPPPPHPVVKLPSTASSSRKILFPAQIRADGGRIKCDGTVERYDMRRAKDMYNKHPIPPASRTSIAIKSTPLKPTSKETVPDPALSTSVVGIGKPPLKVPHFSNSIRSHDSNSGKSSTPATSYSSEAKGKTSETSNEKIKSSSSSPLVTPSSPILSRALRMFEDGLTLPATRPPHRLVSTSPLDLPFQFETFRNPHSSPQFRRDLLASDYESMRRVMNDVRRRQDSMKPPSKATIVERVQSDEVNEKRYRMDVELLKGKEEHVEEQNISLRIVNWNDLLERFENWESTSKWIHPVEAQEVFENLMEDYRDLKISPPTFPPPSWMDKPQAILFPDQNFNRTYKVDFLTYSKMSPHGAYTKGGLKKLKSVEGKKMKEVERKLKKIAKERRIPLSFLTV